MSLGTEKRTSLLGLLPGFILVGFVIGAGAYYSIRGISGADIRQLTGNHQFVLNIAFSLKVACISTVCSILLGTFLALWLWKQHPTFPGQVYTIPLILPHIVAAFFVIVFFSQSGILSSLLNHLNITKDIPSFPVLVFDNEGIGIILAYIYKETAFVALLVLASLRKIPSQLMQTADMFAASKMRAFRTIILPHVSSPLWISGIIVFLYSFGAYDIPYLIGSSSSPMVSIEAYRLFFDGSLAQRPIANLLLCAIWCISMVFLIIFIMIRAFIADDEEAEAWL